MRFAEPVLGVKGGASAFNINPLSAKEAEEPLEAERKISFGTTCFCLTAFSEMVRIYP